ncbi:hypothetical protein SKAU_G00128650 [Synaphobranchus kaupii]|uniref:Kinesin-like protein KIF19 n=1 Tax=Synaphobranchus kaupii TaxID=118154 RepID=A0A9Q1FQD2_SYNKA|nr:hypothetical protein SKAU_G00128650 [Synaphobranchus kaupii]
MKDLPGESKDHQLTVALRIRPLNEAEIEEGATIVAHKLDDQMVVLMDPCEDPDDILRANRSRGKTYMFDVAFDFTATQEDVYVATTKNLIEGVISGYNATVFAYGPTGAGKTYTMLGLDSEPGIYIRTLNDLFKAIEAGNEDMNCTVYMSYLEIYNEMIRDLLNPASGYLDLREDAKGEIRIAGITEFSTNNAKERTQKIMQLLTKGNKQRTQEPTAANKTSSRSHAILQVTVKQKNRVKNINEEVRVGKLFMVDLAGTERASQTQNRGKRMKEGAHINRSLLALANCINALSEKGGKGAQFVNYRDSKLTRLLKDALGGNSRTVMITHISPASTNFEESRNTLIYADKAKNIRTKVKRNLLNVSYHIAQYTSIIADLRQEIERLRAKIDEQGQENRKGDRADIRDVQAEVQQHSAQYSRRELGRLREQLLSAFREQMEIRRSLVELENCNMELHIDTSRHLVTISDWERERARCAKKWRDERHREEVDKDGEEERERDSGGEDTDSTEPHDVTAAREEIGTLLAEQRKTMALKSDLEEKLTSMKLKSSKMEELLPKRISNEEQREILTLLCRVHELEVENTEIQSVVLCKENLMRTKDFVIQRYEHRRALCDEIIQRQRAIIEDHQIPVPPELDELYALYYSELNDGSIDQVLSLHTITSSTMRDGSILNVARQLNLGDLIPDTDKGELSPRVAVQESRTTLNKFPPTSVGDHESESNKVFKSTSKSHQMKHGHNSSSPPPLNQRPNGKDSARQSEQVSPETMKEIVLDTKSISVIAAKRRSHIQAMEPASRLSMAKERSLMSVQSLEEGEEASESQRPVSIDNLDLSTPDELEARKAPPRAPGSSQSTSKKDLPKASRRNNSIERRARKKRSKSFEVNSKRTFKISASRNPGLESISDNRLHSQNANQILHKNVGNPSTPPATKVKYPISHHTGESQIQKLEMHGTPPSTIHQKNAEGRGQTIYKRVRGPSDILSKNQLLLQPGNFKRTANANARHKGTAESNIKTKAHTSVRSTIAADTSNSQDSGEPGNGGPAHWNNALLMWRWCQSTSKHKAYDDKGNSFLSDIDAFINQFLEGTVEPSQQAKEDVAPETLHNQSGEAGKREEKYVPRREWKVHLTPISVEMRQRQEDRKQLIHDLCTNSTLDFLGKNRTFDDIPNKDLDHLIVDDRHGIIYCYVPKVACTNWKRIMIVLSESLLVDGAPYQDPLDIPQEHIHNSSLHFTFNKFWKRYGKFSRHLMKIKLKKYTKFMFVRDPFVRLISAYRNKFEQVNEEFYKRFAVIMLRRYGNYSDPPASVVDAFAAGIRPSFSHFVQYLLDSQTEKEMPFNEHWRQVYRLCHPCQINYDFIGKLETLDEDAEHLLRILRVDNIVQFPASNRNRTVSSWEQDWFAKVPYELRRKLYKLYEADFKLFGYSKPEELLH